MSTFEEPPVLSPDGHEFVGRIFDLSIISLHFETLEEANRWDDVRYLLPIDGRVTLLVNRVESLNRIADFLWLPEKFVQSDQLPCSAWDWLNATLDSFLARFVSILDCCLLLARDVFEMGIPDRKVTIGAIETKGAPAELIQRFKQLRTHSEEMRDERNERFHAAYEREFSSAPMTFKNASILSHRGIRMTGEDENGNTLDVDRYFSEGLEQLKEVFVAAVSELDDHLDAVHDFLLVEFNRRFHEKFNDPIKGYGRNTMNTRSKQV